MQPVSSMIFLYHTEPSHRLKSLVTFYQLLEFDAKQESIIRPWYAGFEHYICIFLKDRPLHLSHPKKGVMVEGKHDVGLLGPSSRFSGFMTFRGSYRCFIIQFTANGFSQLFRIPVSAITNLLIDAEDLLGRFSSELFERLQDTHDFLAMAGVADKALERLLNVAQNSKKYTATDPILYVSEQLKATGGRLTPLQLADMVNMSLRNFERRFLEQVGFSAKMYSRLCRFNDALQMKVEYSNKEWESIARDNGYYDTMHLVKEFKEFAGVSPSSFFKQSPPPQVQKIFLSRERLV